MRLILTSIIMYFMAMMNFSLAQDYVPIVDTLNSWNIMEGGHTYDTFKYNIGDEYVINDTIYNKVIYKRVIESNYHIHAYIREDTAERKVYVRYPYEEELLLYDFDLEIGDTIYVNHPTPSHFESANYYHLLDIDSIELFSSYRRKYTLEGGYTGYDIWIEGVGSLQGLLYPGCEGSGVFTTALLCFYINNSLVYQNPIYESCFVSNVNIENRELSQITIFPNPTRGIIHVDNPGDLKLKYYNVYNSNGNIVIKNQMLETGIIKLPGNLNGILIIELVTIEDQKIKFKIYKL